MKECLLVAHLERKRAEKTELRRAEHWVVKRVEMKVEQMENLMVGL
jgi:hypothetical protein